MNNRVAIFGVISLMVLLFSSPLFSGKKFYSANGMTCKKLQSIILCEGRLCFDRITYIADPNDPVICENEVLGYRGIYDYSTGCLCHQHFTKPREGIATCRFRDGKKTMMFAIDDVTGQNKFCKTGRLMKAKTKTEKEFRKSVAYFFQADLDKRDEYLKLIQEHHNEMSEIERKFIKQLKKDGLWPE